MKFTVVIHEDESGYWVEVPALPGCASQGETLEETLENVKDAIELYLSVLDEKAIPRDEDVVFTVTVAA